MYVYISYFGNDRLTRYQVGFYRPYGFFEIESVHQYKADAAKRVHYLNGGN
jgi:hypothetical protein